MKSYTYITVEGFSIMKSKIFFCLSFQTLQFLYAYVEKNDRDNKDKGI